MPVADIRQINPQSLLPHLLPGRVVFFAFKGAACHSRAIILEPDLEKYGLNIERAEMLLANGESAVQRKK